jgi:hypothetical protein
LALYKSSISTQVYYDSGEERDDNACSDCSFSPHSLSLPTSSGLESTLYFTPVSPVFSMGMWMLVDHLIPGICFTISYIGPYYVPCTMLGALHIILLFAFAI